MNNLRQGVAELAGKKVTSVLDYAGGINGLPAENMLQFTLEDKCSVIVRPSGTEPKVKFYMGVKEEGLTQAEHALEGLKEAMTKIVQ